MIPTDEGVVKNKLPSVLGAMNGALRGSISEWGSLVVKCEEAWLRSVGDCILYSEHMQREVPADLVLAGICVGRTMLQGDDPKARETTGGRRIEACGFRAWSKEKTRRGVRGKDGELIKEESKGLGNLLKDEFAYSSFCAQYLPIIAPYMLYWVSEFLKMGRKEEEPEM